LKVRIPVKLKREAMAEINRLADREYHKVKDKEIADATRRIFKTIVFALNGRTSSERSISVTETTRTNTVCSHKELWIM